MAARSGQSSVALSDAAKGDRLPPLEVALAYVEACHGDRAAWEQRWREAKAELGAAPRRRWPLIAVGVVVLLSAVAGVLFMNRPARTSPPSTSDTAGRSHRFFADADVFNQRHPRPDLSPDSASMVAELLAPGTAKLYTGKAGFPVYRATSSTPTYKVTPRKHIGQWGPNPFEGIAFPWDPSWAEPSPNRPWAAVITADGRSLECLRTTMRGGRPSCEWGAVSDTRGSSAILKGQANGSGLSRLAGIITSADWKAGHIDHALSFGAPENNRQYVFPAVETDGQGHGTWREGQFIWLDPAYDVDADTSLTPYERMIAKALQEYGAFDVKNADAFGFTSEYGSKPPGATGDYVALTHIKFGKYLRVGTITPA